MSSANRTRSRPFANTMAIVASLLLTTGCGPLVPQPDYEAGEDLEVRLTEMSPAVTDAFVSFPKSGFGYSTDVWLVAENGLRAGQLAQVITVTVETLGVDDDSAVLDIQTTKTADPPRVPSSESSGAWFISLEDAASELDFHDDEPSFDHWGNLTLTWGEAVRFTKRQEG